MPLTWNRGVDTTPGMWVAPLLGALLGLLFFISIAGVRVISPTEINWLMQGDWRIHYLGGAFFRWEPWHLPPGRIDSYVSPLGTSIGFTDSIPLAALVLKPFSSLLPASFQYVGAWLAACFALQAFFAVLLMRLWTSSAIQQLLGAACVVLLPTLLMRTLHPALCAHWLLLWALWLYLRYDAAQPGPASARPERPRATARSPGSATPVVGVLAQPVALAALAGMIHPYLAVMTLGLVAALALRLMAARRMSGVAMIVLATAAVLTGWWLSGLFIVSGAGNLSAGGASMYSMNLLAPVTPTGWSSVLPELPLGAEGQAWEGFQYFGLGLLLLMATAAITRVITRRASRAPVLSPLALIAILFAVYALSPRVTFGSTVVLDIDGPLVERLAIFRATGRFFWPLAYVMLIMALSIIVSRLPSRVATIVLCAAIVIQVADLREAHASRRSVFHDPGFYGWAPTLRSEAWSRLLPNYKHLVMYPPSYCGAAPADIESLAWVAAPYGMTINGGLVARFDEQRRQEACARLDATLLRGEVDDATVYVGRPGQIDLLKTLARQPVVCGTIDALGICATARSYERWQGVAHLE